MFRRYLISSVRSYLRNYSAEASNVTATPEVPKEKITQQWSKFAEKLELFKFWMNSVDRWKFYLIEIVSWFQSGFGKFCTLTTKKSQWTRSKTSEQSRRKLLSTLDVRDLFFFRFQRQLAHEPLFISVIGAVLYAAETNPNERTFNQDVLTATSDSVMVSLANRNPVTEKHLKFLSSCYNEGVVRHLSLGIFSFIWIDNFDKNCAFYPAQCEYLQAGVSDFHLRAVDFGFLGKWWNLQRYMSDFDINHSEFPPK